MRMKSLALVLAFTCAASQVQATEYEVDITYSRINQNLFDIISFPMDATSVSLTAWNDSNLGFRITTGKSTETANQLYVEGLHYTNIIDSLWSATLLYRYELSDTWSLETGIGKTDYKSTWKVNGVVPVWGDNSADSDWSYTAGLSYKMEDSVYLKLSYTDYYRKNKEGYGRETTRGFGLSLVYRF